jgi:hypothetical protein
MLRVEKPYLLIYGSKLKSVIYQNLSEECEEYIYVMLAWPFLA